MNALPWKRVQKRINCTVFVLLGRESKRFAHCSIYDGDVHYYSRFGSIVVTADMNGTLDCRSCHRKCSFIHKCMCLWYLRQEDLLQNFRAICAESGDESGDKFNGEDESISVKSQSTSPDNGIALAMCRYLHEKKTHTFERCQLTHTSPCYMHELHFTWNYSAFTKMWGCSCGWVSRTSSWRYLHFEVSSACQKPAWLYWSHFINAWPTQHHNQGLGKHAGCTWE